MSLIDKACWMSEDLEKRESEPEAAELLYSCADKLAALRERVLVLEEGLWPAPGEAAANGGWSVSMDWLCRLQGVVLRDEGWTLSLEDVQAVLLAARSLLAPPVSKEDDSPFECETCQGEGTVDECLGGAPRSNPEAPCPSCDGSGTITPPVRVEDRCICHETTVGKVSCPVHGRAPQHTPNDGEEYPMSDELTIWKSRADVAENEAARLSDELKRWKSRADAAENEAARLSEEEQP